VPRLSVRRAQASYDHLQGFYVGEDGKYLTFLCKLPVDKIIVVCICIWAVEIIIIKNKNLAIWKKRTLNELVNFLKYEL